MSIPTEVDVVSHGSDGLIVLGSVVGIAEVVAEIIVK